MNNTPSWAMELKNKRLAFGISQNKLAIAAEIDRSYLSQIENERVVPSEKLKIKLSETLDRFNPECPLEMLFDYVRIRFPTDDVAKVVKTILRLKIDHMIHEDYGFYSYPEHFRFGDVIVLFAYDDKKGVLLELKGKGCRQYENFLLAQHRSWYEFFADCLNARGIFKRLDLAINDKTGILDVPNLARKSEQEECVSLFRTFKNYRSGELVHRDEKANMGNTLYIGSLKSDIYFCIYEKDYEQFIRQGIPIEDAETKNRFEIRLKNERATGALKDLLKFKDPEKTAFGIINHYLRFVNRGKGKRRSNWPVNKDWEYFVGENRSKLKLTTKPEPYTFDRTVNWLYRQTAPSLKMVNICDIVFGTTIMSDMVENATLNENHLKTLNQLLLPVHDVII